MALIILSLLEIQLNEIFGGKIVLLRERWTDVAVDVPINDFHRSFENDRFSVTTTTTGS